MIKLNKNDKINLLKTALELLVKVENTIKEAGDGELEAFVCTRINASKGTLKEGIYDEIQNYIDELNDGWRL